MMKLIFRTQIFDLRRQTKKNPIAIDPYLLRTFELLRNFAFGLDPYSAPRNASRPSERKTSNTAHSKEMGLLPLRQGENETTDLLCSCEF